MAVKQFEEITAWQIARQLTKADQACFDEFFALAKQPAQKSTGFQKYSEGLK
jgi:hypothetical protein